LIKPLLFLLSANLPYPIPSKLSQKELKMIFAITIPFTI